MSRRQENTEYRRGILLGLTMAEIFIVILFLLLLGLISLMEAKDREYLALKEQCEKDNASASHNTFERVRMIVQGSPPDISEELINVLEMVPKWIEKIDLNKLRRDSTETVEQTISRLISQAKAVDSIGINTCEEELSNARAELKEAQNQIDILKAQQKNYVTQVHNKSLEPPPCWPDDEGRWSDSIFRIELTDKGILLFDSAPPNRQEAKARLPLQKVKYGSLRSPSEFLGDTSEVHQWSLRENCRFLVQVSDRTGDREKIHYKRLYNTVKAHFIIQDLKGGAPRNTPQKSSKEPEKPSFFENLFKPSPKTDSNRRTFNQD